MELPRFLTADNTNNPNDNFVIHTEYPRFIINLIDDEIEWLEDITITDQADFTNQVAELIDEATAFYDKEMKNYEE
ncbi:MAG TPA: hypothetical protein EYG80_01230 [Flavobacteriaceae bacterium]|nr:hypothetical protein [Flavobacteriaceae bacterium]HIP26263.1 hypothetical protein [Flavobacteriaceae bacterium]